MSDDNDPPDENDRRDEEDEDRHTIPRVLESVKTTLEIIALIARLIGM